MENWLVGRVDLTTDAEQSGGAGSAIRTVLIVDDSPGHLRLTGQVLRRLGYEVREATSGPLALQQLAEGGIDLVLSDWVMPGMSGLELCRRFRMSDSDRYVYFILLTSKNTRSDLATGLAAGADDFLSKPIDTQELRARISAGARLVATQRALEQKNLLLEEAFGELQTVYDGIARDLIEARRLQQSLVPDRQKRFLDADVSLILRPCGHVGGDLVGTFRVTETRIGIYAIDVSGHGIASALMTARLASYLTGSSPEHNVAIDLADDKNPKMRPLAEVCERLNRMLIDDMATDLYFTMAIADCDLSNGRVNIVQAGHPHPLVQRADGTVSYLGSGGMPIGLFDEAAFSAFDVELAAGDRLFLYSDGFTEAEDPGGAMLDQDGLARLVRTISGDRGADFVESIIWLLGDHTGNTDFTDDLSGVLLEYQGQASKEGS